MKKRQKTVATIVVMFAIVLAVAIGFWRIMESKQEKARQEEFTESDVKEVNDILKKDFSANYPGTPREVLKVYSRILTCEYNMNLSDEDLKALAEKMRELFDEELLKANPLDQQLEDLKKDVEEYQKAKRSISSYVIDKDSSMVTKKIKGKECLEATISYLLHEGKGYTKTYERFLLRKDENGKWKILGWSLTGNQENEEKK